MKVIKKFLDDSNVLWKDVSENVIQLNNHGVIGDMRDGTFRYSDMCGVIGISTAKSHQEIIDIITQDRLMELLIDGVTKND